MVQTAPIADLAPDRLTALSLALETRLKLGFPEAHFDFGFMPYAPSLREWERIVRRMPFVGLAFTGIEPDKGNGRAFKGRAKFLVTLATSNPQSAKGRFQGDATAPGLFRMIDVAVPLVQGFDVAGVGAANVDEVAPMTAEGWDNQGAAIAGLTVSVLMDMPLVSTGTDPLDLTHIVMRWRHELQTVDGYAGDVVDQTMPTGGQG